MTSSLRQTAFRIPGELLDALQEIKARDGIPAAEQVRRAIVAWVEAKGVRVKSERSKPRKGRKRP